jgi:MFS family permease
MSEQGERAKPLSWAVIAGVIATVSVFAIAQGLTYPLLSFILHRQGVEPALIGLSAAMTPIGFILSSPLVPWLARRFGAGRTALTCAALSAIMLAAIGWTYNLYAWFPLRFLMGTVTNPLYVLSEVWIIALAPPAKRGRIMGIYSTSISAGFAAGPLCLLFIGAEGWPPFLIGICSFIVCGTMLASVLDRLPKVHKSGVQVSVLGFIPLARLLIFAVVVAAGFEQTILALMPVYGAHFGMEEGRVSALLSALIAGNIAMQVPLGLLAERLNARTVRLGCALLTALGCLLLPYMMETLLIWPLVFVWGAVSYGIYTMTIIELGERFSGPALLAGNAAFAMTWGVGGVVLPPLTGAAMEFIGAQGLPLAMGAMCVALALASVAGRPGLNARTPSG